MKLLRPPANVPAIFQYNSLMIKVRFNKQITQRCNGEKETKSNSTPVPLNHYHMEFRTTDPPHSRPLSPLPSSKPRQ
jgi:hypothetical protein